MSRTVIVRPPSRVLTDPSTRVLFRYANGDALVETDATRVESAARAADREVPVSGGVAVDAPEHLEEARATLDGLPGDRRIAAYVELRGPADGDLLAAIRKEGAEPQLFRPRNTYLCAGTAAALRAVRELPFVAAVTPLVEALKPRARTGEDAGDTAEVDIVASAGLMDAEALAAAADAVAGVTLAGPPEETPTLVRIPARVTAAGQQGLLAMPGVLAVEPRAPRRPEDEVAGLILVGSTDWLGRPQGSYVSWLDEHGLNGAGVTIGIVDQGVDVSHPAFDGRIADLADGAKDWHGTFVAGHAAGSFMDESDDDGFVYGIGMAPSAEILAQDNQKDATELCSETVTGSGPGGTTGSIQNNSWGAGTKNPMDYRSLEATYDALVRNAGGGDDPVPLTICFSSGNDGSAGLTRPKAAKNLLVTGNSETYRPGVGGTDADDAREVYTGAHASSHGNCGDGRIRPHVVAPGEWTASANYDSHPGDAEYVSDRITWGGGSSGASPKTAGACALLTQWWRDHDGGTTPSPAMLRALVVNGADPIDTGGPIPNSLQGWGRLNVDAIVRDDVHRTYVDQSILLTSRGESRSWTIRPTDPTQPLWITLAWTDPPGAPGTGTAAAPAIVNRLALRADTGGELFRGNQFEGGWAVPDRGEDDEGLDNLQNIHLRPEDLGDTVEVSITALELAMDCLTNAADTPQQDFALVIRGGFVDRGMTPADVFLVVDDGATAPAEDHEDYWDDGSSDDDVLGDPVDGGSDDEGDATDDLWDDWDGGSTDTDDLWEDDDDGSGDDTGDGWSDSGDDAGDGWTEGDDTGDDTGDDWTEGDDDSTDDDSWWWEEDERGTETERKPVPAAVMAGAAAGLSLARGDGNAAPAAEATRPVGDLGAALARIDRSWARADGTRRRTAVVVVGDATRVSGADVAALRRLAFRGELWVLSTTAGVLGFLAQRVHRRTGVHYRLCADAAELARAVRNALAEAAGLQQLVTRSSAAAGGGTAVAFDVVPQDSALVIRLEGVPAGSPALSLKDGAARAAVAVDPAAPPAGIEADAGDAAVELRIAVTPKTAGTWTLTVVPAAGARMPAVDVYARSALALSTAQRTTGGGPLLAVHGGERARLSRLRLEPARVAGAVASGPAAESARAVDVVAAPSRIANGGARAESGRETLVPSLGAVVEGRGVRYGARVLDLRGTAAGALSPKAGGHRFARVLRTDVIELEPRSRWRARRAGRRTAVTPAAVAAAGEGGGGISALTLRRDGRERRVAVRDPKLRALLAGVDLHAPGILFRVRGDELIGVIRAMPRDRRAGEGVRDSGGSAVRPNGTGAGHPTGGTAGPRPAGGSGTAPRPRPNGGGGAGHAAGGSGAAPAPRPTGDGNGDPRPAAEAGPRLLTATAIQPVQALARPAVKQHIVRERPMIEPIDIGIVRPYDRFVLRPHLVLGTVPYIPTVPAPQLGEPIPVGDFVIWPDAPRNQAFFTLAAPRLRSVALVVKRASVAVSGGTTVKVIGADVVMTVSAYADGETGDLDALRGGWSAELRSRGFANADGWRYEPLSLKAIAGTLGLPAGDMAGPITVAGAPDAGTVTFAAPLSESGALAWMGLFQAGLASRLAGTCTLSAAYVAQLGDTVDVRERSLACDLGTLLAAAGPQHVTVVDPQVTVTTRAIVTALELVDDVTIDLNPSEGAPATSFHFGKEGGQATLPVTSQRIGAVKVPWTATVRYAPPGWPVIQQRGTLDFSRADWDVWVKPDSWLVTYDVFATLLDPQNRVLGPGAEPAGDIVTLRLDYRHPALPDPLSLTLQATSQQLIRVPFPDPPGSNAPPTVDLTVLGARGGTAFGPISRRLTAEETMVVLKSYSNGAIDLTTNRDRVGESSRDGRALGLLARLR